MNKVRDLRSALELLENMPGQLIETDVEVDPMAELSGVYRHVGAGGTVQRPTKEGPAMIFNNVKGHKDARVLIGLLASRKRVAALLGTEPEDLGKLLYRSVDNPIPPVLTDKTPLCQEVVHRATDEDFDLYKLVPAPTNTPDDAGPYITLGMCYASHPDTGCSDVTIHRLCIQSKDELSIFFTPGARHIGAMAERAEQLGQKLPISISIGVDPAIEIGSCFEPPTTPMGYDELAVAGALRGEAVELCNCLTVNEKAIANAEYVIEGEVIPNVRVQEDQNSNTGYAMPEFPGYTGPASDQWVDGWLPENALKIMENALTANNNKIDAVVASNDATAGGAIQALSAQGLSGKVAISGQDADLAGIKRIAAGTQTMTVYKPITLLANSAAEIAVELGNGQEPKADTTLNNGLKDVPSRLLTPIDVNKNNIKDTVVKDGFHKESEL